MIELFFTLMAIGGIALAGAFEFQDFRGQISKARPTEQQLVEFHQILHQKCGNLHAQYPGMDAAGLAEFARLCEQGAKFMEEELKNKDLTWTRARDNAKVSCAKAVHFVGEGTHSEKTFPARATPSGEIVIAPPIKTVFNSAEIPYQVCEGGVQAVYRYFMPPLSQKARLGQRENQLSFAPGADPGIAGQGLKTTRAIVTDQFQQLQKAKPSTSGSIE